MKSPAPEGELLRYFACAQRLKARLDADGTWVVSGKLGDLYEYDKRTLGVLVMPDPPRKHFWGITRNRLEKLGILIIQSGDDEGAALFDPANPQQAEAAIRAAGVKRKRRISPEQREKQIGWLRAVAGRAL